MWQWVDGGLVETGHSGSNFQWLLFTETQFATAGYYQSSGSVQTLCSVWEYISQAVLHPVWCHAMLDTENDVWGSSVVKIRQVHFCFQCRIHQLCVYSGIRLLENPLMGTWTNFLPSSHRIDVANTAPSQHVRPKSCHSLLQAFTLLGFQRLLYICCSWAHWDLHTNTHRVLSKWTDRPILLPSVWSLRCVLLCKV